MIVFPVAMCAVVLSGVLATVAPQPGRGAHVRTGHEDPAAQAASPAGSTSQLVRVDLPAAR